MKGRGRFFIFCSFNKSAACLFSALKSGESGQEVKRFVWYLLFLLLTYHPIDAGRILIYIRDCPACDCVVEFSHKTQTKKTAFIECNEIKILVGDAGIEPATSSV